MVDNEKVIQPVKNKGVIDAVNKNLAPDEEIYVQVIGLFGQTLVATQKRLLIIKPGFMAGAMFGMKVSQYSLSQISGLELRFNLMTGVFEVSAAGMQGTERSYWGTGKTSAEQSPNCIPLNKSLREPFEKAVRIIYKLMDDTNTQKSGVPTVGLDIPDQIRKIADLKDSGIITNEEFENKKQELLGRM